MPCLLIVTLQQSGAAAHVLMQRSVMTLGRRAHLAELLQLLLRQLPRAQHRVVTLHPEGQVIRRVDL